MHNCITQCFTKFEKFLDELLVHVIAWKTVFHDVQCACKCCSAFTQTHSSTTVRSRCIFGCVYPIQSAQHIWVFLFFSHGLRARCGFTEWVRFVFLPIHDERRPYFQWHNDDGAYPSVRSEPTLVPRIQIAFPELRNCVFITICGIPQILIPQS